MNDERFTDDAEPVERAEVLDPFAGFVTKLGTDALRYIPAVILPAVFTFAGVAIFTRVFDPAPYGRYALVLAAAGIGIWIFGGWLQQSVLRYLPRYREQGRLPEFTRKLNTILAVEVVVLAALATAFYFVFDTGASDYARFYFPGLALVLGWVFFLVHAAAFRANLQSRSYTLYMVLQAAVRLAFGLAYVFLIQRDAVGLVIATAASYLVLLIPMWVALRIPSAFRQPGSWIDRPFVRQVSAYGVPVVGLTVATNTLRLADRFIINLFKGPDQVGIYSANYNVAVMFVAFVAGPILLAAEPLLINAWEGKNTEGIQRVITTFTRYFMLVAFPIACFVGVFSRLIATVAFGEEFREGSPVIIMVVGGLTLWNLASYGQKVLKLFEKTQIMLLAAIVSALFNLGLNFVLVPRYGYLGAAFASLVSYALYPAMMYIASKRYLAWVIPWLATLRILIASAAATASWWLTMPDGASSIADWMRLIASGACGVVVYFVVLSLSGELGREERRTIWRALRGFRG